MTFMLGRFSLMVQDVEELELCTLTFNNITYLFVYDVFPISQAGIYTIFLLVGSCQFWVLFSSGYYLVVWLCGSYFTLQRLNLTIHKVDKLPWITPDALPALFSNQ